MNYIVASPRHIRMSTNVVHSPMTLKEQRLAKLIQDRFFRMEWELAGAAETHNLPATSKPLPENSWQYT